VNNDVGQPASLSHREQIRAALRDNPRKMTIQLARELGVPEVEVIRTMPADAVTELDVGRWEELLRALESLGDVHVIVTNGSVTLEAFGRFGNFSCFGEGEGCYFNVQTKSLDMHLRLAVAGQVDRDLGIEAADRALHRFQAGPDRRHTLAHRPSSNRTSAGEVMVDLPPHRRRLTNHRRAQFRTVGARLIHDHRERRLERVRKIAGMRARLLRLTLIMLEQIVQFLHHRRDLHRQTRVDPRHPAGPHGRDLAAHLAQRP